MENLMLLQKQFLRPFKIMLVFGDVLCASLTFFLLMEGETEFILYEFGWLLAVMLILHLILLETRKPSDSLKRLPPAVLEAIDEQCLTGLRFGNGILCDNDCLVFVGILVTAVRLQDVTRLELHTTAKGRITVYGVAGTDSGACYDADPLKPSPLLLKAFAWSNNRNFRDINGAEQRVKGIGAFREADRDNFWRELCDAWKKYTDTEPIEI